jgi:aminomethyltransferase
MSEESRRTPLHDEHKALGAHMASVAGWEMPTHYSSAIEEHRAVRGSAGVFDAGHMTEFRVFGFAAFDFLQRMLTNDLHGIAELGQAQYTLMLDEGGHIIDDLTVFHTGDLEYMLVANAANRNIDLAWLQGHAPSELEVVDESERTSLIALQGPLAMRIVSELAGQGWEPPARFTIAEAMLDTIPALVARIGCTGEDGVEIVTGARHAAALWRAILSFPEVTPAGTEAGETLRVEMGYPRYGSDIDRTVNPVSAGLGWAVPEGKTGFVGEEAVAAVRRDGPAELRVGLRVEGGIARRGDSVLREGAVVGKVASGAFSPTLETGIAIAYVPAEFADAGTQLEVAIAENTSPAIVVELPFVTETSLFA